MPTLTYLGAAVLKLPFIRATSLGHEVLHNWWGNGVYVDYAQGNWSEGLTTFMADYAYKEEASPEAARQARLAWLRDYAAVPASEQPSLAEFRSRAHGAAAAVGYGKSAMVFFMLRDLLGEKDFRDGVRQFWRTKRFEAATWGDLRAAFEHAYGRDLSWFFEQWVERAGAPRLRIESAKAEAKGGAATLALAFAQTAPPYRLRVPVEIVTGTSAQTRWIEIEHQRQTVMLPLAQLPDGVRLDPGLRLWRALDPEQLPPILRRWVLARAPRLALASDGAGIEGAARALAEAFFENPARTVSLAEIPGHGDPVLLVGLNADVDAALARLGLRRGRRNSAGAAAPRYGLREAQATRRQSPSCRRATRPAAGAQAAPAALRCAELSGIRRRRAVAHGVWPAPGRLIRVSR